MVLILFISLLIFILIVIYYNKIKKQKEFGELTIVNNSLLTLILIIVNKIFKKSFNAITNPLSHKIHLISKEEYDNFEYNNLYGHELIHLRQIKFYGQIKFLFKYLIFSIKYGYDKNPLELQAYKYEAVFTDEQLKEELEKGIENIYGE